MSIQKCLTSTNAMVNSPWNLLFMKYCLCFHYHVIGIWGESARKLERPVADNRKVNN